MRNAQSTTETQKEPNGTESQPRGAPPRASIWLDDLSRDRLQTATEGADRHRDVVGVTTNPSIRPPLSKAPPTTTRVAELAEARRGRRRHHPHRHHRRRPQRACDVLRPQWESSDGIDGWRVDRGSTRLATTPCKTVAQAIELWKIVDRPNLLIRSRPQGRACPPSRPFWPKASRSTSR